MFEILGQYKALMSASGTEYVGAGSWRNFSFSDLLLRQGNTDIANLSAANLGVIKVKGPWQLSLPNNVDLEDVLNDTRYQKQALKAVQQLEQVDLTMECIGCNSLARVLKKLNSEKVSSRTSSCYISQAAKAGPPTRKVTRSRLPNRAEVTATHISATTEEESCATHITNRQYKSLQ
ncbi:hypothetical protein WJX82_007605 [Trebouxia sp. C0006]